MQLLVIQFTIKMFHRGFIQLLILQSLKILQYYNTGGGGDPKITGIIFLKWSVRFYTITTLVSFKVLSFQLDTLVPTFFPLLKTFLEIFSMLMLFKTSSVFFFTSRTSEKRFPFFWPFIRGNRRKSHGARSGK